MPGCLEEWAQSVYQSVTKHQTVSINRSRLALSCENSPSVSKSLILRKGTVENASGGADAIPFFSCTTFTKSQTYRLFESMCW